IYAVVVASLVGSALFLDRSAIMPAPEEALAAAAAQTEAMLGSPADVIGHNVGGLGLLVLQAVSLQGPTALAMFLLGMVAARRRLFSTVDVDRRLMRLMQWICFLVGLAGGAVSAAQREDGRTRGTSVSVLTAPSLTAAYVTSLDRLM